MPLGTPRSRRSKSARRLLSEQLERRTLLAGDLQLEIVPPFEDDFTHIDSPPDDWQAGGADSFTLHSRPGAAHVAYLDFDGHVTNGTPWNNSFGANLVTPPFDLDGNPESFNDAELQRINNIWERVAEDFAPFDVNVTTEEPPLDRLINSGAGDENWGVRVSIGGDWSDWFGSPAGGVAFLRSFTWDTDTPTFVWPLALGNSEKNIAEATSHEIGHTLGLSHDGHGGGAYYPGHGDWAPIMGVGYSRPIVQWSRGEYATATQQQDDLRIITTQNGFDYREDDHGDTSATATPTDTVFNLSGVIERVNDVDVFQLVTDAGTIDLQADAYHRSPNLNIELTLLDDAGGVVATSSPNGDMSASLNMDVPAGIYYAVIDGVGDGTVDNGFSEYGSLGQYTFSGVVVEPGPADIDGFTAVNADQDEGNVGDTPFTFELTRSGNLTRTSTVDYAVTGSGGFPADADDFGGAFPSGQVTFNPGEAAKTLTINVSGDYLPEEDEEFTVTLSNPSAETNLLVSTASGVIRDRDILVTNINDSGAGSLRQAVLDANAQPGLDTIAFAIDEITGPIQLQSPLPTITDEVNLLGDSQTGYAGTPLIRIDTFGSGATRGVEIAADNTQVVGLAIMGVEGDGVWIQGDNVVLADSFIGGVGPNFAPNTGVGVVVNGANATVRDSVISGNYLGGVVVAGDGQVTGNRIGVNPAGDASRWNASFGVRAQGDGTVIDGNVISGNQGPAVVLEGDSQTVRDNWIGVAADGEGVLSNRGDGVLLTNGASNAWVAFNSIAFNFGNGVHVDPTAASGNRFESNSLVSNTLFGVELGASGPETNDATDADSGPNGLQNTPRIESATLGPTSVRIQGDIATLADATVDIEFFLNEVMGTDGRGEGGTPLGMVTVTTDAEGFAEFDANLPAAGAVAGQFVAALATSVDGTSEFSLSVPAVNQSQAPTVVIRDSGRLEGDSGLGPLQFEVVLSNPAQQIVHVDFATEAGTAVEASDFVPRTGRVTFAPGETRREIGIDIFGDSFDEGDETLFVNLSNPVNATLLDDRAQGVIIDDDQDSPTRPLGATPQDTSEFLLGDVDVHIVFLESEGVENVETWTPQDLAETRQHVLDGLQWWEDAYANLGFTTPLNIRPDMTLVSDPLPVPVEPTLHASTDEAMWIDPLLDRFGVNTPAPAGEDLAALTSTLRDENGADWAVTLLVVNNTGLKGSFADGVGSNAELGGAHLTILADASPAEIAAQFGRAFYALDERPGGDSSLLSSGYLNALNANAFEDNDDPDGRVASIMAEGVLRDQAFAAQTSSPASLDAVGWGDGNGDGLPDILDVPLQLTGVGVWDETTGDYQFTGASQAVALPNQNPFGLGNSITLNRVRQLQYRVDGGAWTPVADFDAPSVDIDTTFGPLAAFTSLELRTLDTETGVASNSYFHNATPAIDDIDDVAVDEDSGEFSVAISGLSAGLNEDQPLMVHAASGDLDRLADPTVEYTGPESTGVLKLAPLPDQNGPVLVTVTVTDGGPDLDLNTPEDNASTERTFLVNIAAVNDPPTMSDLADIAIDEDTTSPEFAFTIGDIESPIQQLQVSATSDNPDLIRDEDITIAGLTMNRKLSLVPVDHAFGQATITVTVSDPDGGVTQQQVLVDVAPINDEPTVSNLPNVTTAEDFPTALLSFTIQDVETPSEELQLDVETSDESLLPVAGVEIEGTGESRTVRVFPAADAHGVATVTLTAIDADGAEFGETFQVTVNPINDAPDIQPIDDQQSDQDQVAGPFDFTVVDVDDADWTFEVESTNQDLIRNEDIVIEGTGADRTISLTPQPLAFGSTNITITATDGEGETDSETFLLVVNLVNQPPTITPIGDQQIDEDTTLDNIDFTIGDGETDESELQVSAVSSDESIIASSSIQLNGAAANRTLSLTPVAHASGAVDVTVTVLDEGGLSAEQTFQIVVAPVNDDPVIADPGEQTMDEDGSLPITLTLSDPDHSADALQLEVVSQDTSLVDASGLELSGTGADRVLTVTPLPEQSGSTTLQITVTDPEGGSSTLDVSLTVAPVNDPPVVVDSIESGDVLGFQRWSVSVPDPLFTDVDDSSLSMELMTADGDPVDWLTLEGSQIAGRPTNAVAGVWELKVVGSDAAGATAEAMFQVEVAHNDFPWHNHSGPADINDDQSLTPQDAQLQLSYLVVNGSGELPAEGPNVNALRLVDSTKDNFITPQDLAQVVAALFQQASGEGEFDSATPAHNKPGESSSLQADESSEFQQEREEVESLAAADASPRSLLEQFQRGDRATRLRELAFELSDWWRDADSE